ncbi:MAG TPA: hypothetical protein PLA77_08735 [Bacteroidales bacterium]|nr:hypothetical protein [Bacteroidales bacterium]
MSKQKEIDLVELYIKVTSFVKRRFLLLLGVTTLGIGLGLIRHYTAPPRYRVIMIASSEILDKQYVYELASPIEMYVDQREYKDLATYLGCDEKTVSSIKSMELDSTLLHSVKLTMVFSDSSTIKEFREAVVNFYNKQKFITALYENEKKALNDFVKTIDSEIAELNAYQAKMLKTENDAGGVNIYPSVAGSHEELVNLYEKRYILRGKFMQVQPICFITDDLVMQKNKSLFISLFIWGGVFFLLAILLGIYLDLQREAKMRKQV